MTCKLQVSVCQGGLKIGHSQDHILPKYCPSSSSKSAPPPRLALLVYNWSRVLHEVVDQHWPGALLIIVSKVVIHSGGEVEEQIPSPWGSTDCGFPSKMCS